jgi:hypothetical protein
MRRGGLYSRLYGLQLAERQNDDTPLLAAGE